MSPVHYHRVHLHRVANHVDDVYIYTSRRQTPADLFARIQTPDSRGEEQQERRASRVVVDPVVILTHASEVYLVIEHSINQQRGDTRPLDCQRSYCK